MVGRFMRALMVAALLALAGIAMPTPAAAAGDYLQVEITGVSTPVLELDNPDQIVELTGTLTNTSTSPIRYVNVHFWRLDEPITSPGMLEEFTADTPVGARLTSEEAGNLDILTREDEFAPGQRATFSVKASVAQLTQGNYPLTRDDAAYLLGVQVRGIPSVGGNQVVGEDQVVVVATGDTIESSAIVELTAPISWQPDGRFVDDSLDEDLAGRLDTLLASAEREGVIAAVDPALLEAVGRMTEPHVVGGEEVEGSGVAIGWLNRVQALADAGRLWRLPYGNPDLVRARDAGELDSTWTASLSATPEDQLDLPLVAIVGPGADTSLVSSLTGVQTVVARDADGASAGSPAVLGSTATADVAALPDGVRAGRLLADELLAGRPPTYLISTPSDDAVDRLAAGARARVVPSPYPTAVLSWPAATDDEPWASVAEALREGEGVTAFHQELMNTDEPEDLTVVRALAFSSGFDDEDQALAYVADAVPAKVDVSLVTLNAVQSFVMGSRTNTFPATVTNGLDIPVQVTIQFSSDAPQRISVPDVGPVMVGPGESVTVEITPEATANGVTLVHGLLTTTQGTPLDDSVTIEITATNFGRVGWIIIVASGAVVVGGSALRIRAVQRERASKEQREQGQ